MVADRAKGTGPTGNAQRVINGGLLQLGSVSMMTWFVAFMVGLSLVVGAYAVALTSGVLSNDAMAAPAPVSADGAGGVAETAQQ